MPSKSSKVRSNNCSLNFRNYAPPDRTQRSRIHRDRSRGDGTEAHSPHFFERVMKVPATYRHAFALLALLFLFRQLFPVELVTAQTGGNLELRRNVIAGGGNTSTDGGNLRISGTVGQPAAGTQTTGGPITQVGGFWQAILGRSNSPPVPGAGILQ